MSALEFGQHSFALLRAGLAGDSSSLRMFCDLFAEDSQLWLPPTPNTRSPYRGKAAIRELLCGFVPGLYRDGLHLRLFQVLSGQDRLLFQFEDRGMRQDESLYENSPCIALSCQDDQITGFWEYWGGPGFFRDRLDGNSSRAAADPDAQAIARHAIRLLISGMAGSLPDMDEFLSLLADDTRLWFPPTPNTQSPYVGRSAAARLFKDLLMRMYPRGMQIEIFHETSGGTRTAFELQSHGIRADGSEYVNSPCLCLDVKAGRIATLWEHWGGPGFHRPIARP